MAMKKRLAETISHDVINWVKTNPKRIRKIHNPEKEIQLAAVSADPESLELLLADGIMPPEEVQLAAVRRNGSMIEDLIRAGITPSEKVMIAAVWQRPWAVVHIDDPSRTVQLVAVRSAVRSDPQGWWRVIKNIRNPLPEVQMMVLKNHPEAIRLIRDPCVRAQAYAARHDIRLIRYLTNMDVTLCQDPKVRSSALKYILDCIKNSSLADATTMMFQLRKNGCDWKELNVIERRLKHARLMR